MFRERHGLTEDRAPLCRIARRGCGRRAAGHTAGYHRSRSYI